PLPGAGREPPGRKPSPAPRVRDAIWGNKKRMARLHHTSRAATVLAVLTGALAAVGWCGCGSSSPRRLSAADARSLQTLLAAAKWRTDHGQSAGAGEALDG